MDLREKLIGALSRYSTKSTTDAREPVGPVKKKPSRPKGALVLVHTL